MYIYVCVYMVNVFCVWLCCVLLALCCLVVVVFLFACLLRLVACWCVFCCVVALRVVLRLLCLCFVFVVWGPRSGAFASAGFLLCVCCRGVLLCSGGGVWCCGGVCCFVVLARWCLFLRFGVLACLVVLGWVGLSAFVCLFLCSAFAVNLTPNVT